MIVDQRGGVAADERAAIETLSRLSSYSREQPTVYLPAHDPGSGGRFSAREIVPAGRVRRVMGG